MLWKLVRKDLILHWRGIVPLPVTAIGMLLYALLRDGIDMDPRFFVVLIAFMAGFVPVIIAAREDRLRTLALVYSLPVERSTAVRARYLGAWAWFAAFLLLISLLFLAVRGPSILPLLFEPGTLFGMLAAFTLASATMMPFVQRFGMLGVLVALVAFQVLGLLLFTVSALSPGRPWLKAVLDSAKGFFAFSRARLGEAGHYGAIAAVLAACNAASLAASSFLARRREL
jgi:ABC-type transport system involved in multi-copper enzyme maturation permease subunit